MSKKNKIPKIPRYEILRTQIHIMDSQIQFLQNQIEEQNATIKDLRGIIYDGCEDDEEDDDDGYNPLHQPFYPDDDIPNFDQDEIDALDDVADEISEFLKGKWPPKTPRKPKPEDN